MVNIHKVRSHIQLKVVVKVFFIGPQFSTASILSTRKIVQLSFKITITEVRKKVNYYLFVPISL